MRAATADVRVGVKAAADGRAAIAERARVHAASAPTAHRAAIVRRVATTQARAVASAASVREDATTGRGVHVRSAATGE